MKELLHQLLIEAQLAYKGNRFRDCLDCLFQLFTALQEQPKKHETLLKEGVLLVEMLSKLAAFEKNSFLITTFRDIAEYTKLDLPLNENLFIAICTIVEGMQTAAIYAQRKGIALNIFPPSVSFEILEDATISLFLWEESEIPKNAKITELKGALSQLAEKEKDLEAVTLLQIDNLEEAGNWEKSVELLRKLIHQIPSKKGFYYKRIGDLFLKEKQYSYAIDSYLKAYVNGIARSEVETSLIRAAQALVDITEEVAEKNKWKNFISNI